jgi:hypothetical protein
VRPHHLLSLLLLLTACPQKRGGGGPTARPGLGCPAASGVYMASYLVPDEAPRDAGAAKDAPKELSNDAPKEGHTGWVLPLHDKIVDSIEGVPDYQPIDAAAASAAGVPAPPKVAWLLAPGGPCKATIGGYYAAAVDGPPANLTYGVELSGCAAPPEGSEGFAIVLTYDAGVTEAAPPADCKLVPPRPIAARLGEANDKGVWSRPKQETPIPPVLAKLIPDRPCEAPGCEKLWSIAQVDVGGKPVAWAGAVNWLTIPPGDGPDQQCEWKAERFSGFFVAGPDGTPVKVTEAQEHPLVLSAVLADGGGAKALIATAPGEYTTYDLGGGAARVGRHLVWLRMPAEVYAGIDHLGPPCGP